MKIKYILLLLLGLMFVVAAVGLRLWWFPKFVVENQLSQNHFQASSLHGAAYLWKVGYWPEIKMVKVVYTPDQQQGYLLKTGTTNQLVMSMSAEKSDSTVTVKIHYSEDRTRLVSQQPELLTRDVYAGICRMMEGEEVGWGGCYDKNKAYFEWANRYKIGEAVKVVDEISWWPKFQLVKQVYADYCSGVIDCGVEVERCTCSAGSDFDAQCSDSGQTCGSGGTCSCDPNFCDTSLGVGDLNCSSLGINLCQSVGAMDCGSGCSNSGEWPCSWVYSSIPPPPGGNTCGGSFPACDGPCALPYTCMQDGEGGCKCGGGGTPPDNTTDVTVRFDSNNNTAFDASDAYVYSDEFSMDSCGLPNVLNVPGIWVFRDTVAYSANPDGIDILPDVNPDVAKTDNSGGYNTADACLSNGWSGGQNLPLTRIAVPDGKKNYYYIVPPVGYRVVAGRSRSTSGSDECEQVAVLRDVDTGGPDLYQTYMMACTDLENWEEAEMEFLLQAYPTCQIQGDLVASVGVPEAYTVSSSNGATQGSIWWSSTSTYASGGSWTPIYNAGPNGSGTFTCPAEGTYYLACNAVNTNTTPHRVCSGNPWCEWQPDGFPSGTSDSLSCSSMGTPVVDCLDAPFYVSPNDVLPVTCVAAPAPAAPALAATQDCPADPDPGQANINLSWNAPAGAVEYRVRFCNSVGCSPSAQSTNLYFGTGLSTVHQNRVHGSINRYQVQARNSANVWSAWSAVREVTVNCPCTCTVDATNPAVAPYTLNPATASMLVGGTRSFTAQVTLGGECSGINSVGFSSDDTAAVTIPTGLLLSAPYTRTATAVGAGDAIITGRATATNGVATVQCQASSTVTVSNPVGSITPLVYDSSVCSGATLPVGWSGGSMTLVRAAAIPPFSQSDTTYPFDFPNIPAPAAPSYYTYSLTFTNNDLDWAISPCRPYNQQVLLSTGEVEQPVFYITQSASPWFRVTKGDVGANGGNITSEIPANKYFLNPSDISSGVALSSNIVDANPLHPTRSWRVQSMNFPSGSASWYQYFKTNFDQVLVSQNVADFTQDTFDDSDWEEHLRETGSNILEVTGDLTVSGDINVPAGKWTVFVPGNLTVNSANIDVPVGYYLAFVVGGNITFANTTRTIEGVYIADQSMTVQSPGANADTAFIGSGTFVGKGGVTLSRNLDPGGTLNNNLNPAVEFNYRPDLVVNAPLGFKRTPVTWKQVAPRMLP